ncbi:hypothetical protein MTX78_08725 [Hymenobacter tibetensis]|uniref:Uncharacterized protein n=1 Tax=Hymenobacter tibetensis TaxID=497967 RepID=A0ABY4D9C3_9BACT|nr:hypothetical protein [Hymenobacter tibetensis]UOG76673.1 hypothetical protein MTX78_08725 [Hymenobacter tibetensis]
MRTLLFSYQSPLAVLVGWLSLTSACWGSVHSDLFIEPGKQFVLGGNQRGAFKVAARNVGKAAVEVKERPASGALLSKGTLKTRPASDVAFRGWFGCRTRQSHRHQGQLESAHRWRVWLEHEQ